MFEVRFFRDSKGNCPVWKELKDLPQDAQAKAYVRIERLGELGNRLERPECDYLRDGIYELRWRCVKVQYRLLYFFAGAKVVVLSHIITKEDKIPKKEIDQCILNKKLFESNPDQYTFQN